MSVVSKKTQPSRIIVGPVVLVGVIHDVAVYVGANKHDRNGFEICHAWGSDFVSRQTIEHHFDTLGGAKNGVIDNSPRVTWADVHTMIHDKIMLCEANAHD